MQFKCECLILIFQQFAKLVNLDYSNIGRLIWKVRNCIMAKRILKTSIEMICLGDPNEMNFYEKCGLQYEFFIYGLNAI
jgi:hypothetical protein